MLSINQLSVQKQGQVILDNISTVFQEGKINFVGGSNGVGKSTLLKAILRIDKAHTGAIFLNEKDISTISKYQFFSEIGAMIGQNYYDYLSVLDNLDIVRRYYKCPVERIQELLTLFNLEKFKHQALKTLSSGQKQRVSLAISFIHQPKLLVLDEPFNALDPHAVADLENVILHLNKSFRTSFIITCHTLGEVQKIFDTFSILIDESNIDTIDRPLLETLNYVSVFKPSCNEATLSGFIDKSYKYRVDGSNNFHALIPRNEALTFKNSHIFITRHATIEDFYYQNVVSYS